MDDKLRESLSALMDDEANEIEVQQGEGELLEGEG